MMPEDGPSIFQDRLKLRNHYKLPEYLWPTLNSIYVILKPLLMATIYTIYSILSFRYGETINSPKDIDWNSIGFIIYFFIYYFIQTMICVNVFMSE